MIGSYSLFSISSLMKFKVRNLGDRVCHWWISGMLYPQNWYVHSSLVIKLTGTPVTFVKDLCDGVKYERIQWQTERIAEHPKHPVGSWNSGLIVSNSTAMAREKKNQCVFCLRLSTLKIHSSMPPGVAFFVWSETTTIVRQRKWRRQKWQDVIGLTRISTRYRSATMCIVYMYIHDTDRR